MVRILCLGILSTIFLKKRLAWFKWFGMVLVICGLITVGVSDLMNTPVGSFHPFVQREVSVVSHT